MAERAMYLATRLPLLTGGFADIWVSRLSFNPAVEELVAEQLRGQLTSERTEAIEQVMREADTLRYDAIEQIFDKVADERREILKQLIEEEQRLGGLITELRHTLTEANTLTVSADALAQRFEVGAPLEPGEKPFDIDDYRATVVDARAAIVEANGLIESANELLNSPGADRLVPSLVEAINEAGETSEGSVRDGSSCGSLGAHPRHSARCASRDQESRRLKTSGREAHRRRASAF
jgi:hypothetical protein